MKWLMSAVTDQTNANIFNIVLCAMCDVYTHKYVPYISYIYYSLYEHCICGKNKTSQTPNIYFIVSWMCVWLCVCVCVYVRVFVCRFQFLQITLFTFSRHRSTRKAFFQCVCLCLCVCVLICVPFGVCLRSNVKRCTLSFLLLLWLPLCIALVHHYKYSKWCVLLLLYCWMEHSDLSALCSINRWRVRVQLQI